MKRSTTDKLNDAINQWLQVQFDPLRKVLDTCESEIERLLCMWLLLPREVPYSIHEGHPLAGSYQSAPLFDGGELFAGRQSTHMNYKAAGCHNPDAPGYVPGCWVGGASCFFDLGIVHAFSQMHVMTRSARYRLDFAILNEDAGSGTNDLKIVVETDGHDLHERTKEQATRDKRRDRDLAAAGWTVLRFTGSEVWADPAGSVTQIHELLVREDEKARRSRTAREE